MPETTYFHTRDNKFPHQRQNISKPETKYFHTRDKKFPHQFGKFLSMPGRTACLVEPKEHLQYGSLLVQGLRHLSRDSKNETTPETKNVKPETKYFQTREEIFHSNRKGMRHFQTSKYFVFTATFLFWCGNCSSLLGQCAGADGYRPWFLANSGQSNMNCTQYVYSAASAPAVTGSVCILVDLSLLFSS